MLRHKVPFLICIAAFNLLIFSFAFSQKKLTTIIVDAGHGGTDNGAVGQYENSLRSKEKDVTLAISKKLVAELQKQLPNVKTIPTRTTDIYQPVGDKARIANELGGQLFLCIHADSGPLKTGKRQVGTREETRYKYTYTGRGRRKKKIAHPYSVTVPVYEYFKMPLERSGTSVWIFAAHKTSDKLKAIMNGGEDFEIETGGQDSAYNSFNFNTPEGRTLAQIYAKRFQERSDKLARLVIDQIEQTGRPTGGVNQRQVGIRVLQSTNMPAILVETGFINSYEDERYINSEKGQQEIAEAITTAVIAYKEQIENTKRQNTKTEIQTAKEAPENITASFENRPNKDTKILQVKSDKIKVALYDDGEIDGDMVSVYFNKNIIVEKKLLTDKPYSFSIDLVPNKTNELVLYADNLGTIPPNTALMIITDGYNRYEVRLSADLKNNASIKFELKK